MGKLFIVHPGGNDIYSCKDCQTPIAAKRDFLRRCKTLVNGQGLLFKTSCNIRESHVSERITAFDAKYNIVRLLSCLKCRAYMGWRFEFCENSEHRDREGKYLLFPDNLCPGV